MSRPTKDNLTLPDGLRVTWDRGTQHDDGTTMIYGWIEREQYPPRQRRTDDFLILQFDAEGQMIWWYTSSARWSAKLWEFFEEPGEHTACLRWREALA